MVTFTEYIIRTVVSDHCGWVWSTVATRLLYHDSTHCLFL